MRCAIWYHLYSLKNVGNTHGGVLLQVKLQAPLSSNYRIRMTWELHLRFCLFHFIFFTTETIPWVCKAHVLLKNSDWSNSYTINILDIFKEKVKHSIFPCVSNTWRAEADTCNESQSDSELIHFCLQHNINCLVNFYGKMLSRNQRQMTIIHLVRTQNFPKNCVCVSGGRK